MSSSELIHEARYVSVAACAHLANKRNDDATSVLRFFLFDKTDDGYTVPEILDSLVKATLNVAVIVAADNPDVFSRLALCMAAEASDGS